MNTLLLILSIVLFISLSFNAYTFYEKYKKPAIKKRRGFYTTSFTFAKDTSFEVEINCICEFVELERANSKTNIKIVNVRGDKLLSNEKINSIHNLINGWHDLKSTEIEFIVNTRENKIESILN